MDLALFSSWGSGTTTAKFGGLAWLEAGARGPEVVYFAPYFHAYGALLKSSMGQYCMGGFGEMNEFVANAELGGVLWNIRAYRFAAIFPEK